MQLAFISAQAAVLTALVSSLPGLLASRWNWTQRYLAFPLLGLSGLCSIVAGGSGLLSGSAITAVLPLGLPGLSWHVRLDLLSSFFLMLLGAVLIPVAIYGPSYVREFQHEHGNRSVLSIFTGLFVTAMLMVILADDVFMFMTAWELMSLASYFLVALQHNHTASRRAALIYLVFAHIAGLAILASFSLIASAAGTFVFSAMHGASLSPIRIDLAFALALLGFGMKAGLVPVHGWLPEAHPAAPSHISALMSGVMLKVALYGFVRVTFELLGPPQWGWGITLAIVGSGTAVFGALGALMQHDIKRMLAYSSIENMGIVFIALGLSMIFMGSGHPALAALGLAAALYQALNHALFKSLLFLGAGAITHASHESSLEQMGGLMRRMPWTATFFLVGCLSISALPPLNGFVSEWLTFQTALQAWQIESGVIRILVPLAASALALTAGLVATGFVRAYGVGFLGQARSRHVRRAREVSLGMRTAMGLLAAACLGTGIFPTQVMGFLSRITQEIIGTPLAQAASHGWWRLTPINPSTANYSPVPVLLALLLVWLLLPLLFRRGLAHRVRRRSAWDCGYAPPTYRMQYTASAFAQPFRRLFGFLFEVEEQVLHTDDASRYQLSVRDRTWKWLYSPPVTVIHSLARHIRPLQSGRVRQYIGWSLATLVVLLWIVSSK